MDRHAVESECKAQPMRFGFNVSVDQGVIIVGRADQSDEKESSIGAWLLDERRFPISTTRPVEAINSR